MNETEKMYTLREELHLKKIIKRMINWCSLCVTRYLHVFHGSRGPRALRSCIRLWKYCIDFSNQINLVELDTQIFDDIFKKKVTKVLESSIFDYEFPRLVELYKDSTKLKQSKHSKQKTTVFINKNQLKLDIQKKPLTTPKHLTENSDQTVIYKPSTPSLALQMNDDEMKVVQQSRLRSDTGLSKLSTLIMNSGNRIKRQLSKEKKKDNKNIKRISNKGKASLNIPTNKPELKDDVSLEDEKPVDDATQLIMVLKGIRKYLELDWSEYNPSFCTYISDFNLCKITAYQYMSLAFSFANIYLRIVVDTLDDTLSTKSMNLRIGFADFALKQGIRHIYSSNIICIHYLKL